MAAARQAGHRRRLHQRAAGAVAARRRKQWWDRALASMSPARAAATAAGLVLLLAAAATIAIVVTNNAVAVAAARREFARDADILASLLLDSSSAAVRAMAYIASAIASTAPTFSPRMFKSIAGRMVVDTPSFRLPGQAQNSANVVFCPLVPLADRPLWEAEIARVSGWDSNFTEFVNASIGGTQRVARPRPVYAPFAYFALLRGVRPSFHMYDLFDTPVVRSGAGAMRLVLCRRLQGCFALPPPAAAQRDGVGGHVPAPSSSLSSYLPDPGPSGCGCQHDSACAGGAQRYEQQRTVADLGSCPRIHTHNRLPCAQCRVGLG